MVLHEISSQIGRTPEKIVIFGLKKVLRKYWILYLFYGKFAIIVLEKSWLRPKNFRKKTYQTYKKYATFW